MSDELFLDTNAFYYACGLSEITTVDIEKLRKAISASSKTTLSVVSVYEFVSKFRKDIDAIHRGGAYQCEQNIGIAFNPYFSADRELDLNTNGSLKIDLTHITEDQLSRYLKRVINEKVYSEGLMAASILLQLYFIVIYIELGGTTIGLNADQYAALQLMIGVLTKWARDFCKALYSYGYSDEHYEDCENIVKDEFQNALGFGLQFAIPMVQEIKSVPNATMASIRDSIDEFDTEAALIIKQKIFKKGQATKYLQRRVIDYGRVSDDDHMRSMRDKLMEKVTGKYPGAAIREYFDDIIGNVCDNGGAFWKNDILDAMILSNIERGERIITFDKGAIEHMKKYPKTAYSESLKIIDELRL